MRTTDLNFFLAKTGYRRQNANFQLYFFVLFWDKKTYIFFFRGAWYPWIRAIISRACFKLTLRGNLFLVNSSYFMRINRPSYDLDFLTFLTNNYYSLIIIIETDF